MGPQRIKYGTHLCSYGHHVRSTAVLCKCSQVSKQEIHQESPHRLRKIPERETYCFVKGWEGMICGQPGQIPLRGYQGSMPPHPMMHDLKHRIACQLSQLPSR